MFQKLKIAFQNSTATRLELHKATQRLAKQLGYKFDPSLNSEQQTLDLIKRVSATIAITSNTPTQALPKPKPKPKINLDALNLTKRPLRPAVTTPVLSPDYLSGKYDCN